MGKKRLRLVLLAAALLALLAVGIWRLTDRAEPTPEAVFFDVGEGSATLIRTTAGNILIDTGPEDSQAVLCERLRQLGVREFALLVLTHPDEDHIGGADGVLRAFPVQEIWTNGEAADTDSYRALLRAAKQVPVRVVAASERKMLDGVTVTVLSPTVEASGSENENGLVLLVETAGTRLLLMGDAGQETEARLLGQAGGPDLRADILLAGHHGSDSASGAAFLAAVSPREIVISCGAGNAYGHPDGRALARMQAVCGRIRRTDLEGEIHISLEEEE